MKFLINTHELTVNLLEAAEAFDRMETRAKTKGRHPNVQLLDLVAGWIERQCGGQCTRTAAWIVWWIVYERLDILRRKTVRQADVAIAFGVNPFGMTEDQFTGLFLNIPRAKAQQILQSGKYDPTNWQNVYELVLLATGDKQAAERAKNDAAERYVDAQIKKGSRTNA